jgi:hypothetical protein
MASQNPMYFACFPLQEYFVNKDTGFPLAGGYVEFFSDPAFTVPKDVFQQSLISNNFTYTNLGPVLVLSSVGTFQDNNGNDIIPFLYPYNAQGELELYFIRVWSGDPSVQGSVLQFTRQGWPPNLIQSTSPSDVFESSQNLFTNPQFSIVNFVNTVGQTYYEITVSGAGSVEIAPGWSISYAGAGSLKLSQGVISSDVTTNPSYYLQIDSDAGVTPIKLIQRLSYSPRVFENNYLSVAVLANCTDNIAETITVDYTTSSGSSKQVLSGAVSNNNQFTLLAGVAGAPVLIDVTNNVSPATGYVDMIINVPSNRTLQFTSVFGVTVQNATSLVSSVQSTDAQQTNATFWYYKPELEYKPIPSYTLGWDFGMNPFQAQNSSGANYNPSSPGKSVYVADQTILFQNTVNSVNVSKVNKNYMQLGIINNTSATAIIQYLGPAEAQELLNNPVCSMIRARVSSGILVGQINLYYTTAALPTLSADPLVGGYSLVSAVNGTTAAPTVGGGLYGTWTKVNRSNLGDATFSLTTTNTNFEFNGWDASAQANISSATAFAIVVSFQDYSPGNNIALEFVSLQKGYIPTPPAALSFGETLTGLQQYYEKSWDVETVPGTNSAVGAALQQLSGQMYYSAYVSSGNQNFQYTCLHNSNFGIRFIVSKRTNNVAIAVYAQNGTINEVFVQGYNNGGSVVSTNLGIATWNQSNKGQNGVNYLLASPGSVLYQNNQTPGPINTSIINGYLSYHYVADARLGIV